MKSTSQLAQSLLQAMTADMQAYILPDSKVSDHEFASQMIGHLDGPQQRAVQAALEAVQVEQKLEVPPWPTPYRREPTKEEPCVISLFTGDQMLDYAGQAAARATAFYRAIATPQEPAAPAWLPIETSPRDGAFFLATDGVRFVVLNHPMNCYMGVWHLDPIRHQWRGAAEPSIDPTHWTPIPEAPGEAS